MAPRGSIVLASLLLTTLVHHASAHSSMTYPQSTSPGTCRVGGEPKFGVMNCKGPCDERRYKGKDEDKVWLNYFPPNRPSEKFRRGQKYTVKYTRNNHPAGGFVRLTLVPLRDTMSKRVHKRNAFHYSCWGANVAKAKGNELKKDKYGFSMIGSDAQQHDAAPGYYTVDITIPPVVPNGKYMLGWVWFGGTSGPKIKNNNGPPEPKPWSYFGTYWSCAFVEVVGDDPVAKEYMPVFVNDMEQFSSEGCMAHADETGVCDREPCRKVKDTKYRKPRKFIDGSLRPLTPADFGGETTDKDDAPRDDSKPDKSTDDEARGFKSGDKSSKDKGTDDASSDDYGADKVSPSSGDATTKKPTKASSKPGGAARAKPASKRSPKGPPKFKKMKAFNKRKAFLSCYCALLRKRCSKRLARRTYRCRAKSKRPTGSCKNACCKVCRMHKRHRLCRTRAVRSACNGK